MIKEEKQIKYWLVVVIALLSIIVSILLTSNGSKTKVIDSKNTEIEATIAEKKRLEDELESAEAPMKRLSSYEEKREEEIAKITAITNEIKTYEEARRLRESIKEGFEQQIRCQRAVNSNLEDWDCDLKEIYSKYLLR